MQEKINGFKKVTQQYGTYKVSTEIDGETARITGPNYFEMRGSVKVNDIVNGYGPLNNYTGLQPMYTWTHMVDLVTYAQNDDVKIYDGTSLVPSLNPFKRIFGDEFDQCVIWPLECKIVGNGYDYSNYVYASLGCTGTHWMFDDTTAYIFSSIGVNSFQQIGVNGINNAYSFKADSTEIYVNTDSYSESGTPNDDDHKFNILFTLACQKISL